MRRPGERRARHPSAPLEGARRERHPAELPEPGDLDGLDLIRRAAEFGDGRNRRRERGYAVSLGERQNGAASIAAPVFDHAGAPAAVISVCGPLDRFRHETDRVAGSLIEATTGLTRRLGGTPPPRG